MADKVLAQEAELTGIVTPEEFKFVSDADFEMRVFDAETNKAFGRKLKKSLPFKVVYKAFRSLDAVRKHGEYPKDSDLLSMINSSIKAAARAAFTNANVKAAGYKAPDPNNPQLILRGMIDSIYKARKWASPTDAQKAEALAAAEAASGIKWEEMTDELEPTPTNGDTEVVEEVVEEEVAST